MGSMSGKSLMVLISERWKWMGKEGLYRFLSTDERAKCERRRAIAHTPLLLWHRRRFHKNWIFNESGQRWGFRRVTFTSLWIGTVNRSTWLRSQGSSHAEGGVGGFSGEIWRKLHGYVTRDGKRYDGRCWDRGAMSSRWIHRHCAGNGASLGTRKIRVGGEARRIREWDGDAVGGGSVTTIWLGSMRARKSRRSN